MTTKIESFLHERCKENMCEDCVQIAEEYQELLELRTRALQVANYNEAQAKKELAQEKRRADMYEEISKAGMGEIISAWMDKEIKQLLKGGL